MKVDWEWYWQVVDQGLEKFFARPSVEPRVVRAMLRRSSYLGGSGDDDETGEPFTVRVVTPFTEEFSGRVYVTPDSELAGLFRQALNWGEDRMATLELAWVRDQRYGEKGPRVAIRRLTGWGLAINGAYSEE